MPRRSTRARSPIWDALARRPGPQVFFGDRYSIAHKDEIRPWNYPLAVFDSCWERFVSFGWCGARPRRILGVGRARTPGLWRTMRADSWISPALVSRQGSGEEGDVMIQSATRPVIFDETAVANLKASLRGSLILPDDEGYDAARRVYNGMIDKRPGAIARCVDVADVMAAVNFAREHQVTLAIRGGGHNGGGLGVCDDGLVIDLSPMKGTHVDPAARTVRVQGGCTWGDVDHATHPFGLATPSGFISTTGVGGLTLGGGIGYLTRAHGLTLDNLLGVDLVLADGSFVTADADHHA